MRTPGKKARTRSERLIRALERERLARAQPQAPAPGVSAPAGPVDAQQEAGSPPAPTMPVPTSKRRQGRSILSMLQCLALLGGQARFGGQGR